MKLILYTEPIPKMRHRTCRNGKFIRHYDPQETEKIRTKYLLKKTLLDEMAAISACDLEAYRLYNFYFDYYKIKFIFHMKMPDFSKKKGILAEWGHIRCTKKPDIDNLEKFYLDCMNGIFFRDDASVVEIKSKKRYSKVPRVEIEIEGYKSFMEEEAKGILTLISQSDVMNLYYQSLEFENFTELTTDFELENLASNLSKLADEFADKFKEIKKKYPNYRPKNSLI